MPEEERTTPNNGELPSNWKERSSVFKETYPDIHAHLSYMATVDLRLNGQAFDCDIFPCMTNDEKLPEIFLMICNVDGEFETLFYPFEPTKDQVDNNGWNWLQDIRKLYYLKEVVSNDDYIFRFNYR